MTFSELPLWEIKVFVDDVAATIYANAVRENYKGQHMVVKTFTRTVRAGGAAANVKVVVVRVNTQARGGDRG